MSDGLHETIGEPHGEIEVCHFMWLEFQCDEVQDVGVVDSQNAHIGAPPGAALFDDIGRQIEQAHE